jgi:6-phosphofructokinase
MTKHIGVLTAGGDSPGLNALLRGIGKAAHESFQMEVIGFRDGFRGLMENRTMDLDERILSGILTLGGTILGTSRDKPHRMLVGGKYMDMTDAIVENYRRNHLDVLVCIGGGGTQKNAYRLLQKGLNIITLPKTIDNDVVLTDVCFGFNTALGIATEAIDRLHSTAHSHHRIILVETMGHSAGWLALGAGVAGGADVILIPEIPYSVEKIAKAILDRSRGGKHFSIVAVAEGAIPLEVAGISKKGNKQKKAKKEKKKNKKANAELAVLNVAHGSNTLKLATQLEELTRLESRVTILGYLQRGGTPSAIDRILATRLGTACAALIHEGAYGVMLAAHGDRAEAVPLEEVVGKVKTVPLDHSWIDSARRVGTSLGD